MKAKGKSATMAQKVQAAGFFILVPLTIFLFYLAFRTEVPAYQIIHQEYDHRADLISVFVRLDAEIPEKDLTIIADDIHGRENIAGYGRFYIWFLLPGQQIGSGSWAAATYGDPLKPPGLHVEVLSN